MQGATFIDAAVMLPSTGSWRTLMFQGNRALRLNWDSGIDEGPCKITELEKHWADLANTPYAMGVDAAVQLPYAGGSWHTLLFKNNRCLELNWDTGIKYEGLITEYATDNSTKWGQLSATVFANGVDTAIQLPNANGCWRTMLFKLVPQQDPTYDQYAQFNWSSGIDSVGSIHNYGKQWNSVSSSFGSGFVALEIPNDGGHYRTMLFKGANCYYFNWDSGNIYEGPITGVGWRWADAYNALTS